LALVRGDGNDGEAGEKWELREDSENLQLLRYEGRLLGQLHPRYRLDRAVVSLGGRVTFFLGGEGIGTVFRRFIFYLFLLALDFFVLLLFSVQLFLALLKFEIWLCHVNSPWGVS